MNINFENFLLYYTAFHEREINIKYLKETLISEIGENGLKEAIAIFRQKREAREATGDKRTLYDVMKGQNEKL